MRPVLYAIGVILILATVLPLVRTGAWWIRIFDFPRQQIAILLGSVFFGALFYGSFTSPAETAFLLALAMSFGYQCCRIFPYTPFATKQVADANPGDGSASIRLLIANVLMDNRRAGDFIEMVRAHDPDVILALETDDWWDRQLASLEKDYPFALKHPLANTYGMHLFSRLELRSPMVRFLVEADVPSVHAAVRLGSGEWIDLYGVHPRPPKPQRDTEKRDAEILIIGKEAAASERPAIIAGDYNDVAWSHTTKLFQRISHTLDPRVGRGMFSTFHAKYPMLRWPLDHVFHEASFTLGTLKRLGYFGSDHFPVLVELVREANAGRRQMAPPADRQARREAEKKIEHGQEAGDREPG